MGGGGGSEHRNNEKKLTNTASPQEKTTKHRHRKSATRSFSAMIRSSTLKIILLYLKSILLMPVLNHLVFLFLRSNLARRKWSKEHLTDKLNILKLSQSPKFVSLYRTKNA